MRDRGFDAMMKEKEETPHMKRVSPYRTYIMHGKAGCFSSDPDRKVSEVSVSEMPFSEAVSKAVSSWNEDRRQEILSVFLGEKDHPKFRGKQEEIIESVLSGNDTFAILPTGSGKSLCFQGPSIFFPGITLVISPLAALTEDQVDEFNKHDYKHPGRYSDKEGKICYGEFRFQAIYPGMRGLKPEAVFSEIQNKSQIRYKLLYVSPERLRDHEFRKALQDAEKKGLEISHVVIDEVHCMSQWGFEFRESYLHIADFIRRRPIRPVISAFTATAAKKDIRTIKALLHFPMEENLYQTKKYKEIFCVEKRKNLLVRLVKCSDYRNSTLTRQDALMGILEKNMEKECVIYRTTTAGVDELYDILKKNSLLKDRVVKYHAKMSKQEKGWNKDSFLHGHGESAENSGDLCAPQTHGNIMIATKAFGMGINKKDISLVIHYDVPRSLEDYYQEAGRAGRDIGKVPMAECILLYSEGPRWEEKGTLLHTINLVTSGQKSPDADFGSIFSRFSDDMKKNIYFWSYYRMCYVRKYCNIAIKSPDKAHDFIESYLKGELSERDAVKEFESFHSYIEKKIADKMPADKKDGFVTERLFRGADAVRFLNPGEAKKDKYQEETKRLVRELVRKELVGEIDVLHINNTHVANILRHHPGEYGLNKSQAVPAPKKESKLTFTFTIYGSEKPSYFDMCVLDAIYSIEITGKETIYVETIWEILTGRSPRFSSREKSSFRADIQKSIDKMRALSISLSDHRYKECYKKEWFEFEVSEKPFLPLTDKSAGEKGYLYRDIPPLFQYAEKMKMNGIIKAPVLQMQACSFRPSTENAMLCHYLIHRTIISKRFKTGNFINFSTIREILSNKEDASLFATKVFYIMDCFCRHHYQKLYYAYIKDYCFHLAKEGRESILIEDFAYFQISFSAKKDVYPTLSELAVKINWFSEYEKYPKWSYAHFKKEDAEEDEKKDVEKRKRLSDWLSAPGANGYKLSAETKAGLDAKRLGKMIGRMEGIVLQHE